jgi:Family of unknown function (DUF5681)
MPRKAKHLPYEVGKGKPRVHAQFRKGQSGNPGGRPRGTTALRARNLVLEEAYRMVTLEEGDDTVTLPALQAILRSQIALAANGNGPAQRAVIAAVQVVEQQVEQEAQKTAEETPAREPFRGSLTDAARRVAFLLKLAENEQEEQREQQQADAAAGNAPVERDDAWGAPSDPPFAKPPWK